MQRTTSTSTVFLSSIAWLWSDHAGTMAMRRAPQLARLLRLRAMQPALSCAELAPMRSFHASPSPMASDGSMASLFQARPTPSNTILRIVPQQTAFVVERFGKYHRTLTPGLHILIPVVRA